MPVTLDQDPITKDKTKIMQWYNVSQGGGLIVNAPASELSEIGSSPGLGHCIMFLDKTLKVHLTPKYFFRSNKSLHLFEMQCTALPLFNPNLDFLQAVKVMKSGHHLLHERASKGYGSILGLHACLQRLIMMQISP